MADIPPQKPPETLPINEDARRKAIRNAQAALPGTAERTSVMKVVDAAILLSVPAQSSFQAGDYVGLKFENNPLVVLLDPSQGITLGRQAPTTSGELFIDLTPFGAYPLGVSRQHVFLQYGSNSRVELRDLGSSNGTYINGDRLTAHKPSALAHGDLVHLGQMEITVVFYSKEAVDKIVKQS